MTHPKTLLITGGTGSFGNAVLRRVLRSEEFSAIRIFSRDEKVQVDMRQVYRLPHRCHGQEQGEEYLGDARRG